MLLRQENHDGIALLCVSGPVGEPEADGLVTATARLLEGDSRGVVLDFTDVPMVTDSGRCRLSGLLDLPSGFPRAPLVLCPPHALPDAPSVMTAANRTSALAQVEARCHRPRTWLEVPHDPSGPAAARAAVCDSEHLQLQGLSDDVALVVSEMVTNAVRHAAPPVHVEVETTDDEVLVAVCDGSPVAPARREADEEAEGGRGMLLVDLLTADHGVRPQPPGKTVWARIKRPRQS